MKNILSILVVLLCLSVKAQQTEYVDFKTAKALLGVDFESNRIKGSIEYEFDILKATDSLFIDAVAMTFEYVQLNGKPTKFYNDGKKLWVNYDFIPSKLNKISIGYSTIPKKAMYFLGGEENHQIWTQGQGKYTSNWLPSIDDMNEKIEFDLSITYDNDYTVLANGKLINKEVVGEEQTKWYYDMQQPMSSYLVALAIGKYNKKVEISKSGIPLEMYYYPEDSAKVEPTYRYTKQMFDFLEEEIGVPFPWQNYKQVPVKDFLYAGMENTSLTIFSDAFMVDNIAFVDKNYVNVNAHELAHQWFGDLVTETEGTHHWLQEGFATYYALLAEREVFGDDYYYWKLYEYAQELLAQEKAGESTALLDTEASSTTFYKKGAWVLHMLREQVGDKAFKTAVKNYLEKYQFKNVETNDFITEIEKVSGEDLNGFVNTWLKSEKLPEDFGMFKAVLGHEKFSKTSMLSYLGNLNNELFQIERLKLGLIDSNSNDFKTAKLLFELFNADLVREEDPVSEKLIIEYLKNLHHYTIDEQTILIEEAFKSKNIKVRQTLSQVIIDIWVALKTDYESLLNDKSYITIETALYNLWTNFPEDRSKYLDKTKDIIGFNDKNVRTLWLTLVLLTPDYEPEMARTYYEELVNYTDPKYGFEVRQNAFQYLKMIQACNDECNANLKEAATHYNWRFKSFAKQLLEEKQ